MNLTLGISPCPNDTFIFDALANKKIDTGEIDFDIFLEDVETLNQQALQGGLDISKISYGVLPLILDNYKLITSGGALGKGVGPLLIAAPYPLKGEIKKEEIIGYINNSTIAIPGINTTAHMLFSLAFPQATNKRFMRFNEIEDFVLIENSKETKAGVIIHENRFTYQQKGLHKLMDLGEYWETETGLPIPLGGIVAKRNLDKNLIHKIDELIKQSLQYAFTNYKESLPDFVKQNAREMEENIMWQHIKLYVNNYSIDLGDDGKKAVMKLLELYNKIHNNNRIFNTENIFND